MQPPESNDFRLVLRSVSPQGFDVANRRYFDVLQRCLRCYCDPLYANVHSKYGHYQSITFIYFFRVLGAIMCGVAGVIGSPEASREVFLGLTTLQHRGQDAAGIITHDETGFHQVKNLGLVESVFTAENMAGLTGEMAIAHNRYSTIGRGDINDVQPFLLNYPYGLGLVHNGNIVNYKELSTRLKEKSRRHLLTQSDSEILLNIFAEGLAQSAKENHDSLDFESICTAATNLFHQVNGSCSAVMMIADHGLVAFRDPWGLRPLVWGKKTVNGKEAHMFASESVALSFNGYELVRDLEPGEVIFVDRQGKMQSRVLRSERKSHCMFEWVYFASPESVIESVPVYGARIELGKNLAELVSKELEKRGLEADLIVPVPETSRIAAIALAERLKVPYRETLIKNRYIKRTFILSSQDKREKAVNLKLSPVKSEIEGRRILLVDDSIVRGTTSRKLIELVRKAGAKEVYFVSTCPPIKSPCYYGIDFPDGRELVAYERNNEEIEKTLGADAVIYIDVENLVKSIQKGRLAQDGKQNLCTACLDQNYPTDVKSAGKDFAEARSSDRAAIKETSV